MRIKGARIIYGSNYGAAYFNNELRAQAKTLRPGTIVEKPSAGEVVGFYKRSLEVSSSVFSAENQKAVVEVLKLPHKKITNLLVESLGKEKFGTYYRGARLSGEQLDQYLNAKNEGKPVATTFFMSVSASKDEASGFTKPKFHQQENLLPVSYVIHGSARELKGASFEEESLFMPGSQFNVTEVTKQNGSWQIGLEQLADRQKSRNAINI